LRPVALGEQPGQLLIAVGVGALAAIARQARV
jgi:hypothetical protein